MSEPAARVPPPYPPPQAGEGKGRAEPRPFFWWFVPPALALGALFAAALIALFQYGFREHIPGSLSVGGFTLDNFVRITRQVYFQVFAQTIWLALATAAICLLLGYPLAYALVRTRSRGLKSLILILTIAPLFTSEIVRAYAWTAVLGNNGFINGGLRSLGLLAGPPFQMLYTSGGVTAALVQYSMPIMVIILAAALSHIDLVYERAASSLGAGPVRVFLLVTLPLSAPGILSGFVTIFAWTMSAFATPQLVGGGKVIMIANMIYNVGFSNFDFPFAAALSLVALALTIALLWMVRRFTRWAEAVGLH